MAPPVTPAAPAVPAEHRDWQGTMVPPEVHDALSKKWRGQPGIAARQAAVLDFFVETAALKNVGQTTMAGGAPPTITREANVVTEFRLKGEDQAKPPVCFAKYGQINPTRMLKHVLNSTVVSDDDKVALCTGRTAAETKAWLSAYNERARKALKEAGPREAVTQAELASLTKAEREARKRQQTLDERVVHKLTAMQIAAIHYCLCTFFFICRIPFTVIEHWAFFHFANALNPAYAPFLFKRTALSTTWLKKLRADTEEKTDAFMESTMGRKTIIVDGFKDRRGRHVMNISNAKVGFAAYVKTAWFGRKQHSGETYANEISSVVGDGKEHIACCADNTSSNTSMQNGLFGRLSAKYYWFFLGCCVHCMDLLSEDVAKLADIAAIITEFKFVTRVVLRFSLLTETFLHLQSLRHKSDPSASMLMLKKFPDTRFAYAFFVIYAVILNWSVLQALVDSPEYKLLKSNATPKRRLLLRKFESIVGDPSKKAKGEAAVDVMRPISSGLHYLEGDDVPSSHVLPVYGLLHQSAQKPGDNVTDEFSTETINAIAQLFKDRWNGSGRKVGIRNDLHCLAWKLDIHARLLVVHAFSNGGELLAALDASFEPDAVTGAIGTYSQGIATVEAQLTAEYESFSAKTSVWSLKWKSAKMLIETKLPRALAGLSESTKKNPVTKLIELLKCSDMLIARTMFKSMYEDPGSAHELKLFANVAPVPHMDQTH